MKVSQFEPYIGQEEYESIKECFDTNWLTEGPKSKQFVEELCKNIGVEYGVLAPNGTLSLSLGLMALGIGKGDEVIVPDFTFIASATSICLVGSVPRFADIDLDSLQINIKDCERLLSPKTKAIMPVHIYGMSCDMTQVMNFAKEHNLFVIEDSAQAIDVSWLGKKCGSFGDVGSFSFFADKTISTIEGGFVATNNKEIFEKLSLLRNQGRMNRGTFIHPEIGFNFRMNDIQSSIGLVQLKKLEEIKKKKEHIFNMYWNKLKDIEQIDFILPMGGSNHIPFRVCILINENQEKLSKFMKEKEIESRTFFYPLHKQPCFKKLVRKYKIYNCDYINSTYAFDHGLCLPSYPSLEDDKIEYVCDTIKKYFNGR